MRSTTRCSTCWASHRRLLWTAMTARLRIKEERVSWRYRGLTSNGVATRTLRRRRRRAAPSETNGMDQRQSPNQDNRAGAAGAPKTEIRSTDSKNGMPTLRASRNASDSRASPEQRPRIRQHHPHRLHRLLSRRLSRPYRQHDPKAVLSVKAAARLFPSQSRTIYPMTLSRQRPLVRACRQSDCSVPRGPVRWNKLALPTARGKARAGRATQRPKEMTTWCGRCLRFPDHRRTRP